MPRVLLRPLGITLVISALCCAGATAATEVNNTLLTTDSGNFGDSGLG